MYSARDSLINTLAISTRNAKEYYALGFDGRVKDEAVSPIVCRQIDKEDRLASGTVKVLQLR